MAKNVSIKPKFIRFGSLNPIKQEGFGKDSFHAPPAKKGMYAFVENHKEEFLLWGDMSRYGSKNPKYYSLKDKKGNKIKITADVYSLVKTLPRERKSDALDFLDSLFPEQEKDDVIKKNMACPYFSRWVNKEKVSLDTFSHQDYENWQSWLKKEIKKETGESKFFEHFLPEEEKYLLIKRVKMKKFSHKGPLWHHLDPSSVSGITVLQTHGSWVKTSYEDFCRLFKKEYASVRKRWINDDHSLKDKDYWTGRTSFDHLEVFIEKIES